MTVSASRRGPPLRRARSPDSRTLTASAAARPVTQTLVFDAGRLAHASSWTPARRPQPGDTELSTARLRDASRALVGTARDRCVFTEGIPNDVLEHCSGSANTREGSVTLTGVGHLDSMNPPWQVIGRSGTYRGLHGTQVFATDIPLDPNDPLAAGRGFSVSVITVTSTRRLHVGVVTRRPQTALSSGAPPPLAGATETKASGLPGFPFSTFDPFHPDKQLLPQVGRFFDQPARRRLPTLDPTAREARAPPATAACGKRAHSPADTASRTRPADQGRTRRRPASFVPNRSPPIEGLQQSRVSIRRSSASSPARSGKRRSGHQLIRRERVSEIVLVTESGHQTRQAAVTPRSRASEPDDRWTPLRRL